MSMRGGEFGRFVTARCAAVVGLQWGDEGKGKIVDLLASGMDAVVRYNGGANAGHSVVVGGERYALHLIPSGVLQPGKASVIANGVVVDPEMLVKEIEGLRARGVETGGIVLSDRAHVVMPYHKEQDSAQERSLSEHGEAIGTTGRGIGPCYADKAMRSTAVRVGDLLDASALRRKLERVCAVKNATLAGLGVERRFDADELSAWAAGLGERLRAHIADTTYLLHGMIGDGKRILFEGANAALLDVDHGTHPFVTSSSCTALGIPAGTGVPCAHIGDVLGVVKAYSTRVGNGPMPTELADGTGDRIRERGREFGTTTGRPRRVGWLDLVAVRYAAMLNGATALAVTLLDVLSGFDEIRVCTGYRVDGERTEKFRPDSCVLSGVEPVYESMPGFCGDVTGARGVGELPREARAYLERIEGFVGVPVKLVGVGPDRAQTIAV